MEYYKDEEYDLYVIKLNQNLNNMLFQKTINKIVNESGLGRFNHTYYTFFDQNYNYCIVDFHKRKFSQEDLNDIIETQPFSK